MKPFASSLSLVAVLLLAVCPAHAQAPETKTTPKKSLFVIPPDINGLKTIIAPPQNPRPIKVAIFQGKGAPDGGIQNVEDRIKSIPNAVVTRVSADQWATIDLKVFDVVAFSGGSGSAQAASLGEAGRKNVVEFIRGGGGYVGVCAGAYLACANYDWSLGILNAATISRRWQRGQGFMDLEMTEEGRKLLGDVRGTFKVRYNNGPIIQPAGRADVPPYAAITLFRSEISKNDTPVGIMINSPAQATGAFGKGRVFISSPHPENTPGLEHLIPRAVLWAAGGRPESSAIFNEQLEARFASWDSDRDGSLTTPEIDKALADPSIKGDAAAALAVVKRLARSKTWSAIPRTMDHLMSMTSRPKEKEEPDLAGMFADSRRRIATARRELFVDGAPSLTALHQGKMGNCFSLAPLGCMLSRDPAQVKAMIRQNSDGTYAVRLGARVVQVTPPTDAEIALSSSNESTGLWSNVYEKAAGIARNELREGKDRVTTPLDAIARGGSAGTMLAFITGNEMVRFTLQWAKDERTTPEESEAKLKELRALLVAAFREGRCVTTGTTRTTLPGLYGGHAYGVIGYNEKTDEIRVWDPHGDSFTPKGALGTETGYPRKDGIFDLPLSLFAKQFAGLAFELKEKSKA